MVVQTTEKYLNWAEITEQKVKEKTVEEIKRRVAKVVDEEKWTKKLEKKNSLGVYRRFKKWNERGRLLWKFRVNVVVDSGNN